jgi:glycosyltransferase involved in cell wall biosynthesis
MIKSESISVIIPALNEEQNLTSAVDTVVRAVKRWFLEYEIFIFNDGSTDNTGYIANQIADRNRFIRTIHNDKPVCLGEIYNQGRKLARMDYLILVNGKNDISSRELEKILSLKGKADIIVPYTINRRQRPFSRRIISSIFVFSLNLFFNLNLKYYNHYVLHKREIINSININTVSYAFQAEALIKLIKRGHRYIEVGVRDDFSNDVETKAFRVKNILGVTWFFCKIFQQVYFKGFMNFNYEKYTEI